MICRRTAALLILSAAIVPSIAHGQASPPQVSTSAPASRLPTYRYRLLGIYDEQTGQPIEGVEVLEVGTGIGAQTSKTGTMTLFFLPDGGGLVRIRKLGYEVQLLPIAISAADTAPLTLTLARAQALPTVVTNEKAKPFVVPKLRGFEDRRRTAATGHFITDSVLRAEEGRPLASVLRAHLPGITILDKAHANYLMKSPRCAAGGPPEVYVDGVPMARIPALALGRSRGGPVPPTDLSQLDVSNFAAVEYYPDSDGLPAEFNHTAEGCGALVLWTR